MKTFDLNGMELTKDPAEADFRILPKHIQTDNGTIIPPPIYYMKPNKKIKIPPTSLAEVNTGKVEWHPSITIDPDCRPKDYIALVAWWFGEFGKEENKYFRDVLEAAYPSVDLREAMKPIRKSLEHFHAFESRETAKGIKYTSRIKRVDDKIRNRLRHFENKGWYKKG